MNVMQTYCLMEEEKEEKVEKVEEEGGEEGEELCWSNSGDICIIRQNNISKNCVVQWVITDP